MVYFCCIPPEDEVVEELPGDIMVGTELLTTSGVFDSLLTAMTEVAAAPAVAAPDAAWTGLRMGLFRLFKWYR